MRIGSGYDVHALVAGRPSCWRRGRSRTARTRRSFRCRRAVACDRRCVAGSARAGRLGRALSRQRPALEGRRQPRAVARGRREDPRAGWEVGNVDATVIAQAPKVAPFVTAMRANVAADLGCDPARISVKATTTERLGFAGARRVSRPRRWCCSSSRNRERPSGTWRAVSPGAEGGRPVRASGPPVSHRQRDARQRAAAGRAATGRTARHASA